MSQQGAITIRTRKYLSNRLLNRKQMVVDVYHHGRANVSKADLREQLVSKFRVKNPQCVMLFGFKTAFGGGRSTGFALIYDTIEDVLDTEPKYRLVRAGLKERTESSLKQRRELKNKRKKVRGKAKRKVGGGK